MCDMRTFFSFSTRACRMSFSNSFILCRYWFSRLGVRVGAVGIGGAVLRLRFARSGPIRCCIELPITLCA